MCSDEFQKALACGLSNLALLIPMMKAQHSAKTASGRKCRVPRLHITSCWSLIGSWHWSDTLVDATKYIPRLAMPLLQSTRWSFNVGTCKRMF